MAEQGLMDAADIDDAAMTPPAGWSPVEVEVITPLRDRNEQADA